MPGAASWDFLATDSLLRRSFTTRSPIPQHLLVLTRMGSGGRPGTEGWALNTHTMGFPTPEDDWLHSIDLSPMVWVLFSGRNEGRECRRRKKMLSLSPVTARSRF